LAILRAATAEALPAMSRASKAVYDNFARELASGRV